MHAFIHSMMLLYLIKSSCIFVVTYVVVTLCVPSVMV